MNNCITTLRMVVLSMIICCVAYPLLLLAFARVAASDQADGSLIRNADGTVIGSALLAQAFEQPRYFWPRPSAANYDASATGGSNLSPTNPSLGQRARQLIARHDLRPDQLIPAELVTASGSGMDPHLSLDAARFQAPRVAAARQWPVERVYELIEQSTEASGLSVFGGEPLVNVLKLNLGLDTAASPEGQ